MDQGAVLRKNPNAAYRIYDGQATIVLPERAAVHVLNTVGSLVWDRIDGTCTVAQLVQLVLDEYDVAPEEARRDVLNFIERLREQEMVF